MPFRRITFSGRYLSREEAFREWKNVLLVGGLLAAVDVALSTVVGYTVYKTFKGYFLNPRELGFYCNDESIRMAWKPNTVSPKLLIIGIIGSAPVLIAITEALLFQTAKGINLVPKWIRATTFEYLKFIIGFSACISVMEFFKATFGTLRPYFLEVCAPDWSKIDCSVSNAYVPNAYCTGDLEKVRNARSSFPSGHSAAASFHAVYLTIYFVRMARAGYSRPIQVACSVMAVVVNAWTIFILVTRITDNRHHLNDVIFACLLGIGFAVSTASAFTRQHVYEEREVMRDVKFE